MINENDKFDFDNYYNLTTNLQYKKVTLKFNETPCKKEFAMSLYFM